MKTFTQLKQSSKDAILDDNTTTYDGMSSVDDFIETEINNTTTYIFSLFKEYRLQPKPVTIATVADQIYYPYPAGFQKMESLTINLGTHAPPLQIIDSQEVWDYLQQVPVTSGFPTAVFPRRRDFGIYPTPQGAYNMSLTSSYYPITMTEADYTDGTVTVANGDATITGSGTTFTQGMEGRFFVLTNSSGIPKDYWYYFDDYTSTTVFELDRTYEGLSASSQSYLIGQSPNMPEELHEFIPIRVAATYYAQRRRDFTNANRLMNYFYTGDYENPRRTGRIQGGILKSLRDMRERGRGNSQLVEIGGQTDMNFMRDGIWGLTLS